MTAPSSLLMTSPRLLSELLLHPLFPHSVLKYEEIIKGICVPSQVLLLEAPRRTIQRGTPHCFFDGFCISLLLFASSLFPKLSSVSHHFLLPSNLHLSSSVLDVIRERICQSKKKKHHHQDEENQCSILTRFRPFSPLLFPPFPLSSPFPTCCLVFSLRHFHQLQPLWPFFPSPFLSISAFLLLPFPLLPPSNLLLSFIPPSLPQSFLLLPSLGLLVLRCVPHHLDCPDLLLKRSVAVLLTSSGVLPLAVLLRGTWVLSLAVSLCFRFVPQNHDSHQGIPAPRGDRDLTLSVDLSSLICLPASTFFSSFWRIELISIALT